MWSWRRRLRAERPRIEALMDARRLVDAGFKEVAAAPPAREVGAVDALSLAHTSGRRITVYLCDGWDGLKPVETALGGRVDRDGVRARSTTNGSLLAWVEARRDDPGGEDWMSEHLGRFAGRE